MKIGVVIQRFGDGLTGGAEYHARRVAEHLKADGHDVTVLTSTSRDARKWDNAYPPGTETCGGLTVIRFPVRSSLERNAERLRQSIVMGARLGPSGLSRLWSLWGNPYTRDLVTYLEGHAAEFDAIFFFTCFYYPSLAGPAAARGTFRVAVPLAHDDPFSTSPFVADMLRHCEAIVANSEEEKELLDRVRGADNGAPIVVAGCGIDPPATATPSARPIAEPYVLYIGRQKDGTELLPEAWSIVRRTPGLERLTLVTVGDEGFRRVAGDGWRVLGHVSESERWSLTEHAEVVVNPSLYESLSLTLIESWWMRVPVLVRDQCLVMKHQVERACGGLPFHDAQSFTDQLSVLMMSPARRREMGERGRAYVEIRYTWPQIMRRYRTILSSCTRSNS